MKGTVTNITKKYIYTTEYVEWTELHYFVELEHGHVCTVYYSEEAAMADVPYLTHAYMDAFSHISCKAVTCHTYKHHRYQNKGQ